MAGIKKMYKNRYGKEMTKEEQTALFSYNDLNGFIQAFLKVQDLFVSEKDFNVVFKELEKYLVRNGIDYCEAFFAPTAFLKKGFSYKKMVQIFHKQIARIKEKDGITIKLLMDVSRTFGCENAMKNYELLKQYPCEDIIGILHKTIPLQRGVYFVIESEEILNHKEAAKMKKLIPILVLVDCRVKRMIVQKLIRATCIRNLTTGG